MTLPRLPLPSLLRRFWAWSAVAFGLMLAVAYGMHYNPMAFPLFGDLMVYFGTYQWLHTPVFFFNVIAKPIPEPLFSPVAYPPFGAVVYAAFYSTANPVLSYLGVMVAWVGAAVWGVRRGLMKVGLARLTATLFPLTLALISFPIARLVDEGNLELVLWILAAVGAWAYLREADDAAAVLWGLAAAMKLYPVILLLLFLPRRRWRAFAVGVATFAGATALSLWWLGPTMGVAWRGSIQNVFGYQGLRASEWSQSELVANHSVFGLVKLVAMIAGVPPARLTLPYYVFGAVAMGLTFFGRLWKMPVANQLLAVTVFMVMFPPVTYYHTLLHLYAPFVALVFVAIRAERAGVSIAGLRGTVMLFVPLFASYTLYTFPRVLLFGGLVQACLLLLLFLCALQYPFSLGGTEASAQ
jgi:hypothetical protein